MKRIGFVLIIVGFLLSTGCEPAEIIQEPVEGSVIGHGVLNVHGTYSDSQPTVQQDVKEGGTIPFEILFDPDGVHDVEGKGAVTVNYAIEYLQIGETCVYQAIADAEVKGELFEDGAYPFVEEGADPNDLSFCQFNFVLKFNYPKTAHLISGSSSLCGELEWESATVEIQGMKAIDGTKVKSSVSGLAGEIVLTNLVTNEVKKCNAPRESDIVLE